MEQPEDRGILLRDILETTTGEKGYNLAEPDNKAYTLTATYRGAVAWNSIERHQRTMITEPVRIGTIENELQNKAHDSKQYRVYSPDGKATTICGQGGGVGAKTGLYACPCEQIAEEYFKGGFDGDLIGMVKNNSVCRNGKQPSQQYRIYSCDGKSVCVDQDQRKHYIVPATGKEYPIYEVRDGLIIIKDKQYPIKLADGFYIIRKLTPIECERLQTLPDNYTAAVSNTQRYKGLGNGWTAEVIIHILNGALKDVSRDEEIVVLSMYDGIGTGRYCLDKMGFTNVKYYAYEIDKYAKQIAMSNYPDIIQMGDAFDIRQDNWCLIS